MDPGTGIPVRAPSDVSIEPGSRFKQPSLQVPSSGENELVNSADVTYTDPGGIGSSAGVVRVTNMNLIWSGARSSRLHLQPH